MYIILKYPIVNFVHIYIDKVSPHAVAAMKGTGIHTAVLHLMEETRCSMGIFAVYTGMMHLSDGASQYIYGMLYVLLDLLVYTILLHRSIRL